MNTRHTLFVSKRGNSSLYHANILSIIMPLLQAAWPRTQTTTKTNSASTLSTEAQCVLIKPWTIIHIVLILKVSQSSLLSKPCLHTTQTNTRSADPVLDQNRRRPQRPTLVRANRDCIEDQDGLNDRNRWTTHTHTHTHTRVSARQTE